MHFPDTVLPEEKDRSKRSNCLRVGTYIVICKLLNDCKIPDILRMYFNGKDAGLFLDFDAYSIVTENNAAQYYPDYAYNHALFAEGIRIYSGAKLSDFFHSITEA